jgi:hypothetical protein
MIKEITTYNDYKITLLKLIKSRSLKMLEDIINDDKYIEYIQILKSDDIIKEKWINRVLKVGDRHLCDIVLNLFEIEEEVPECDKLSDIIYITDLRYRSNLINKRNNIYYIFDLYNLEGFDNSISVEDLYYLYEDQVKFKKIKLITEEKLCRTLDMDEIRYILEKSIEYRDYINNEYNNLIENIIEEEGYMDSDIECYNILYNYLGKKPNKFEVKLLMKLSV